MQIQKNQPLILVKSNGIRPYLPFSNWIWTKQNTDWFKINLKMVNIIWFPLTSQESEVDFSVWKCLLFKEIMVETFTSRIKAPNLAEMLVLTYWLIRKYGPTWKYIPDVCWHHENREECIIHFSTFYPVNWFQQNLVSKHKVKK